MTPVHVVGTGATAFAVEQDAMLDELVFDAVHSALAEAGLRQRDTGLAVTASMDVFDARSISSGLTNTASGGYRNESYRIEGDSGRAVGAAAQAVAAGDVDVAIAVGVHNPETTVREGDGPAARRRFSEQLSNLGFEPAFDRPIGLTAEATYGLHAMHAIRSGAIDIVRLATLAAAEISRGARRDRSIRRDTVNADDVLKSDLVMSPLSELMLPAHSAGAVAVVLASPARAARCRGRSVRITGLGHATGDYTWGGSWLSNPGVTTRSAARQAYASAGIAEPEAAVRLAELSAPTPALHRDYADALGLGHLDDRSVNASGGVRSNYPGLANGALRLLELVEEVERLGSGSRGLSHSVDTVTGLVSEDVTVAVVEVL
jgi:acetyl-CoA acetyltransferase